MAVPLQIRSKRPGRPDPTESSSSLHPIVVIFKITFSARKNSAGSEPSLFLNQCAEFQQVLTPGPECLSPCVASAGSRCKEAHPTRCRMLRNEGENKDHEASYQILQGSTPVFLQKQIRCFFNVSNSQCTHVNPPSSGRICVRSVMIVVNMCVATLSLLRE
jgi:hypothetical protein